MSLLPDLGSSIGGPLVAGPVNVSSPFDGLWLVQDGMALADAIGSGDWVQGGMAAFSLLLDGVAALIDPIGTLIGMGLSWVLEHIWPLNEYLNLLTGNAGEVLRMSQTWANISTHLAGAGANLDRILGDLDQLEGAAIEAYRRFQADMAKHVELAGTLASATSAGLQIASTIVKIVHDLTRDVISQIAGTAISAALTTVVTVGFGAPVAIAQIGARVAALVPKVTRAIEALLRSFEKLGPLLRQVDEIYATLKRLLDRVVPGGTPGPKPAGGGPAVNPSNGGPPTPPGARRTPPEAEGPPRPNAGDGQVHPSHGSSDPLPPGTSPNPQVQATLDLRADPGAPYGRFPDGTPMSKADYDERFVNPDGSPRYPSHGGAVPGSRVTYSDPVSYIAENGPRVDRVGDMNGSYLGVMEDGRPASFEQRGLPVDSLAEPYTSYSFSPDAAMRMTEDGIQIQTSRIAEAFGQPGGGLQVQFFLPGSSRALSVQDLFNAGYLI
jgi:hypothetical protein